MQIFIFKTPSPLVFLGFSLPVLGRQLEPETSQMLAIGKPAYRSSDLHKTHTSASSWSVSFHRPVIFNTGDLFIALEHFMRWYGPKLDGKWWGIVPSLQTTIIMCPWCLTECVLQHTLSGACVHYDCLHYD